MCSQNVCLGLYKKRRCNVGVLFRSLPRTSISSQLLIQLLMAKDYQRLWKDITDTIDEAKAVRILAEILVDKEGRAFISRLDRKDAELCIEILDLVSCDLRSLPLSPSQRISAGHRRA